MKSLLCTLLLLPTVLFAEGEAPAPAMPPAEQGFMQTFVMIGIALLFFYVILWRPEQKRRKAQETLRSSMKKGDKVTAMGIIGVVSKVNDQTVVLQMVDGSKIEMLKAAVSEVLPSGVEEIKKEEQK